MAKKKYRVSCPHCGNWLLNSDELPEKTSVFNCGKCRKSHELSQLNVK